MALRLRRDVQKASYYVWFLGAEEAKGLRGARVINSVLPYLIDRSRGQEPLKVTLQVSHKGIKILQGSSKHFIPHSAITSSVQTNDIVACVLLLYNPATKCPLHVHAYRCDSESTAEALHQQLQILINRAENQKRFEELETRLGILPPLPTSGSKSTSYNNGEHSHRAHYQSQSTQQQQLQHRDRHDTSPKRFSSSLGSDTGNSTRESECSEEQNGGSPISRSPPILKALPVQQNNELFDSLAAELRAKLNGNGPPLLLPPRDYDTVHRSKGNLTAIELRRCRNSLIVGTTTPTGGSAGGGGGAAAPPVVNPPQMTANVKQVSSRGSSGIGSDLAPSPERQDLNSSSDDDHWSNEADNSVIALKPSQIALERSGPIIPHHPQLNRKSAVKPPEDSYLRDLPAKPYMPRHNSNSNSNNTVSSGGGGGKIEGPSRSKPPSNGSWSREDEIKPIIMRPADYDAKFNRVLQSEQKEEYHRRAEGGPKEQTKLRDTDKYNEINRLLSKKLALERGSPEQRYEQKSVDDLEEDFDDSDRASDNVPLQHRSALHYSKENLTDKQKFMEYTSKKTPAKTFASEEVQRYGGRHRYVDPADLPFEQPAATHKKYSAVHRGSSNHSTERSDLGHRTAERDRDRQRERERERQKEVDTDEGRHSRHSRERERKNYSQSNERNPYREPESIPYIQSMEKMMKSSAMRYKTFDGVAGDEPAPIVVAKDEPQHTKISQRSKSYPKHVDELPSDRERDYARGRPEVISKDRFKETKNKFHGMERTGSRYDLADKIDGPDFNSPPHHRGRGSVERVEKITRVYEDWSDDEHCNDDIPPPVNVRARSRSRDDLWDSNGVPPMRGREVPAPREHTREHRDYQYDMRSREPVVKRPEPREIRDTRYEQRDRYDGRNNAPTQREHYARQRDQSEEFVREHVRRDYSPDNHSEFTVRSSEKKSRAQKPHPDMYPTQTPPPPPTSGAPVPNTKSISNMAKGYRHSYAEPVFARSGGRVGLAAVNPY